MQKLTLPRPESWDSRLRMDKDRGLALAQGLEALGDLVGGQVFDVGGDGPLVVVGVGDAGEAGAVELVGGLGGGTASPFGFGVGDPAPVAGSGIFLYAISDM